MLGKLNFFSKDELKYVSLVLISLFGVFFYNITIAERRGRDSTRKNDISAIQKGLDSYLSKYGVYPISTDDGRIVGCFNEDPILDLKTNRPTNAIVCDWGQSSFENMSTLPRDPKYKEGSSYRYISDGENYYFFISLEGKDEAEYSSEIESRNLQCGNVLCNYGRGSNRFAEFPISNF